MHRIISAVRGNIVAWLALFVALGGTSLAASHYIITSTKQIKPSVLKTLRGKTGATGAPGGGAVGPGGVAGAGGVPGTKGETGPLGGEGKEGPKGATGLEGPKGTEGKAGDEGPSGTSVVARARSIEAITPPDESEHFNDPLNGGTWTQQADELNAVVGQVTVTAPSEKCVEPGPPLAWFEILLDGDQVALIQSQEYSEGETRTLPFEVQKFAYPTRWLYEPGKATSHTLTVQVKTLCGTGKGSFTVKSVSIDVIGVK